MVGLIDFTFPTSRGENLERTSPRTCVIWDAVNGIEYHVAIPEDDEESFRWGCRICALTVDGELLHFLYAIQDSDYTRTSNKEKEGALFRCN